MNVGLEEKKEEFRNIYNDKILRFEGISVEYMTINTIWNSSNYAV